MSMETVWIGTQIKNKKKKKKKDFAGQDLMPRSRLWEPRV